MASRVSVYADPWRVLRSTGHVTMCIVGSTREDVIKKLSSTYRKALQKQKHQDIEFRKAYPFATMSSRIEGNNVKFTLDYKDYSGIRAEDL